MNIEYRLLYDVGHASYRTWTFSLGGLGFVVGGAVLYFVLRHGAPRSPRKTALTAAVIVALVGIGFGVLTARDSYAEYSRLRGELRAHRFAVVEGRVRDFVAEGPGGHPAESWSVNGHTYRISSSVSTSGFNTPGVIKPADSVRIADVDGLIARLEVAK